MSQAANTGCHGEREKPYSTHIGEKNFSCKRESLLNGRVEGLRVTVQEQSIIIDILRNKIQELHARGIAQEKNHATSLNTLEKYTDSLVARNMTEINYLNKEVEILRKKLRLSVRKVAEYKKKISTLGIEVEKRETIKYANDIIIDKLKNSKEKEEKLKQKLKETVKLASRKEKVTIYNNRNYQAKLSNIQRHYIQIRKKLCTLKLKDKANENMITALLRKKKEIERVNSQMQNVNKEQSFVIKKLKEKLMFYEMLKEQNDNEEIDVTDVDENENITIANVTAMKNSSKEQDLSKDKVETKAKGVGSSCLINKMEDEKGLNCDSKATNEIEEQNMLEFVSVDGEQDIFIENLQQNVEILGYTLQL